MTREEVDNLLDKVKRYRPFYSGSLGAKTLSSLQQEWFNELKYYDYEDVNNKLNEFLRNEDNNSKIPNPYQLKDNLITIKTKESRGQYRVTCSYCKRWLDENEIEEHEDRCRSINYISRLCRRFYNKDINNKNELYDMSNEEFSGKYINLLQKIFNYLDVDEKKKVENVIETYYGREPKYSTKDMN